VIGNINKPAIIVRLSECDCVHTTNICILILNNLTEKLTNLPKATQMLEQKKTAETPNKHDQFWLFFFSPHPPHYGKFKLHKTLSSRKLKLPTTLPRRGE
jgi:hypothetical protein